MLLITHPDNVKKIQSVCKSGESYASHAHLFHSGYKLIECTFMPPTRPSGMYSISGSGRFKPEEISLKTPFITYGPEDLDYLIYAGVAEEIQEMNVLCMHESQFASANQAMRCTPAQFDFFRKPVEPMMMSGGSGGGAGRKLAEAMRLIKDVDLDDSLNIVWKPKSLFFGNPFI